MQQPSGNKDVRRRGLRVALTAVFTMTAVVACSSRDQFLAFGAGTGADGSKPGFGPSPDGGDAAIEEASTRQLACIATTCPEGFATCETGTGPAYKCGADLKRDRDHCGSCDNQCPTYAPIHMISRCIEGGCELECWSPFILGSREDWRDCNATVDDGCEVDVLSNVKHCGACGNACADGEPCRRGICGCAPDKIPCEGRCIDPKIDDRNCGGCGTVCNSNDGPCSFPNGGYYGCVEGLCGKPKCLGPRGDCNNDLRNPQCISDGCEVPDLRTDPNNCGGCGIVCNTAQGELCIDEGNGPECAVPCARYGQTLCAAGQCRDLLNDPNACGSCGRFCPGGGPQQTRSCRKGICELDCLPGFADCNGDPNDGCEVDLMAHPENCGACGNACDRAAGQPCVAGKCLMTECDSGVVQ